MKPLRGLHRLFHLDRFGRRMEESLDEELRFHLETRVEQFMCEGLSPDEARVKALKCFGNPESVVQQCRGIDRDGVRRRALTEMVDELFQDLRFAFRTMLRSPLFTVAAVVSLALGIGANAAVYTFLHGFLIAPLPVEDAGRLVTIMTAVPERGVERWHVTYEEFLHFRQNARSLAAVAATELTDFAVLGGEEPLRMMTLRTSADYFDVLGVSPVLGRTFASFDAESGASPVVLIGEGLWNRNFGGDPEILGRTVRMNGVPYTIIGIMPDRIGSLTELWIPIRTDQTDLLYSGRIRLLGRMQPETSIGTVRSELDALLQGLLKAGSGDDDGRVIQVDSYRGNLLNENGTAVLIFYTIVSLVLLLACANVANLLLARGAGRQQEFAVRASLGAGRFRIVRQLLVETVILAGAGGLIGLFLARWGRDAFLAGQPYLNDTIFTFEISTTVVLAMVGISFGSALLSGLVPALVTTRTDLSAAMRAGTRRIGGGGQSGRTQALLAGLQVGVAVVVLVAAGLMAKGFLYIQSMELGFNPRDVVHVEANLASVGYQDRSSRVRFFRDLMDQIAEHPEAVSVSASNPLPYIGWLAPYEVEGAGTAAPRSSIDAVVTPGHFRNMEIRLLAGRDFSDRDVGSDTVPVAVVSEQFARLNWPDEDPIGRRFRPVAEPGVEYPWYEVIGVVADTRAGTFMPTTGCFYLPHGQHPSYEMIVAVRTRGEPGAMIEHIKQLIWAREPDLALQWSGILTDTIRDRYNEPSLYAAILGILSIVAIVLACVGVYGVLAYGVARRSREFGIHLAIGARPGEVLRLVLRHGGRLTAWGMAGGFLVALLLMRLAASILYGVSPYDPLVYGTCALLMIVVALAASLVPALRATRIDPVEALRAD
ncbi:ADOP family duplicated permease [Gemmatimonadota bacterium]